MIELPDLLGQVEDSLGRHQPELQALLGSGCVCLSGTFVCMSDDGPFDRFEIEMEIGQRFPFKEPSLREVGNRIPHTHERHVFSDGTCCLGLWEAWLLKTPIADFEHYLTGPVTSYFVSQSIFEQTDKWPFGEQGHSAADLAATYAEALGLPDTTDMQAYFRLLTAPLLSGNPMCPCGAGARLRDCHWRSIRDTRGRVDASVRKKIAMRLARATKE